MAQANNEFIEQVATYVRKYAPKYNIQVYSPIIAQAILESASGRSELAVKANNYFGLKYKAGRCPTANGVYYKNGSEQNPDGSYSTSAMQWCKFPSMEACVIGYFDFTNIDRYSNLKGVTSPQIYLKNIKKLPRAGFYPARGSIYLRFHPAQASLCEGRCLRLLPQTEG